MSKAPSRLSRRDALRLSAGAASTALAGLAGSGVLAAGKAALGPAMGSDTAQLLMLQEAWSVADVGETILPAVKAIYDDRAHHTLVLLPPDEARGGPAPEAQAIGKLGGLARALGVFVAGAATVRTAIGAQTIGFVFDPAGRQILRIPKITPDFLTGFSDTIATTGKPVDFFSADTPFGRLGMLVGEDILYASHVRSAFFAGAEIVLNPAIEIGNDALEARRELPKALCVENNVYIASATPSRRTIGGFEQHLPSRTCLTDWKGVAIGADGDESAVVTMLDVDGLRAARMLWPEKIKTGRNGQTLVRDALYAPQFEALAAARPAFAMPSTRNGWRDEAARRIAAQAKPPIPAAHEDMYNVILAQVEQRTSVMSSPGVAVMKATDRKAEIARIVKENLHAIERLAAAQNVRLVVFPEFGFSGAGFRTVEDIRSVALRIDGPELTPISTFAQKNKTYVAFEQMEDDPAFPGYVFNTAYLIGDNGEMVIKHRKMQDADQLGTLPTTTPGSVFDRYQQVYGFKHLADVADTPIGRIGLTICYENMWPEVTELLAQKGAEIITHSTSESYDGTPDYGWDTARRQMALTSTSYLISVDAGEIDGTKFSPYFRPAGRSEVIDFNGRFIHKMQSSEPGILTGTIDLAALREARKDPRRNMAIWDDPRSYVDQYRQGIGIPNNLWTDPDKFPYAGQGAAMDVQKRLIERNIYVAPVRHLHRGK